MEPTRRFILKAAPLSLAALATTAAPAPYGVLPTAAQVAWSELEFYNFLHFTVNTFTDKEWGEGSEDPAIFNPTAFDPDAICSILKDAGSKGVILTCKHHDGFCLWPTKTTDHSIRNSPYKNGKGDIVKELSQAAARSGLKFGVYLSPWDRNQATYGTPEYIQIYRRQMRELLTGYGEIFEIWHDGANGGSGFYGGANEKRIIDKVHYYDWQNTWKLEHELQPGAVRFSDIGPDIRWVGNEKGIAGKTCWATYSPVSEKGGIAVPGDVNAEQSTIGTRNGKFWMPAECDVSIRPGWFWHAAENDKVKTAPELFDLFLESTGRGASFLLNVPPDRRGLIYETDAASLRAFGKMREATFSKDLAEGAKVQGWNTPEATFILRAPASVNLVRVRENIRLGQRIGSFAVDYWQGGQWLPFAQGTSIGCCRILKSSAPVTTDRVRLRITDTAASPQLSHFGIYNQQV